MGTMAQADLFATKGIEYILVLIFLALVIPFGVLIVRLGPREAVRKATTKLREFATDWFRIPAGVHFHPGHSWARVDSHDTVRVGLDDFAHKLIGDPTKIELPELNSFLEQGQKGWQLTVGSETVEMLSPVRGAVIEVNPKVLETPDLVGRDPYGEGWLLKLRVPSTKVAMRNLLSGRFAKAWMDETANSVREHMGGELGLAMQDGGVPISGFAKQLSPNDWQRIASKFLLTE